MIAAGGGLAVDWRWTGVASGVFQVLTLLCGCVDWMRGFWRRWIVKGSHELCGWLREGGGITYFVVVPGRLRVWALFARSVQQHWNEFLPVSSSNPPSKS